MTVPLTYKSRCSRGLRSQGQQAQAAGTLANLLAAINIRGTGAFAPGQHAMPSSSQSTLWLRLQVCNLLCTVLHDIDRITGSRAAFYGEVESLLEHLRSCTEEQLLQHDSQGNTVSPNNHPSQFTHAYALAND